MDAHDRSRPGLRAHAVQFLLLAVVNCFVGGVVGAQRSILPLAGESYFGVASAAALTSFVVSFGVVKACMNLVAGRLAERMGRRAVLLMGWAAGIPIPLLLWLAVEHRAWWIVVAANVLLGINQGLCWTMTVVMKVDLVGSRRRGLALGVNEAAGYTSVALSAFAAALVATDDLPLRGIIALTGGCVVMGLVLSAAFVRETRGLATAGTGGASERPPAPKRGQLAAAQAGLVCNMNDAIIWTTLPLLLAARQMEGATIGFFAALYPAVWGLSQLATGAMSDRVGRGRLIVFGMLMQGAGHVVLGIERVDPRIGAGVGCVLLGLGTALAYPSLLAFVADGAPAVARSKALGSYRFFRDMGYAVGALGAGFLVDASSLVTTIHASGVVTVASGVLFALLVRRGKV